MFIPALAKIPPEITYSTAPWWKAGVDWVTQDMTIDILRDMWKGERVPPGRWIGVGIVCLGLVVAARAG